jgi:hypothetical protein
MSLRPRWAVVCAAVLAAVLCATQVGDARPRKPRKPRPSPAPAVIAGPSPIVVENTRAGTGGWLGPDATGRAAEVYASVTDALPGETVDLHVSTQPASMYRVLIYRLGWYGGVGARQVACIPGCSEGKLGATQPVPGVEPDGRVAADWPVTGSFKVDPSWVSGYYLVRVLLLGGTQEGASATTYVIVNAPKPSHALVQVPANTWQAYNNWGGKSLYPFSFDGKRGRRVSFNRPYDWSSRGAQSPLGWELPLIRFLEREGYDVSYQSDVVTDANPDSLLSHRVVIDAGHDEYWSRRMRDGWEAARAKGVNLAFMGANDAYWQVAMENGGRTVMSYKSVEDPNPDPSARTSLFRALEPPRLECDLMGVQHQGGPLTWPDGDYVVQGGARGDPWLRGTGLNVGDSVRGIVSREVDTIPGTASEASSCGHELTVFFHRELGGDGAGNADAVRYTTALGSFVFAAGSLNFSWGLDDAADNNHMRHGLADDRLQRFAHNMFAAMGAY